jgi:hypothetical protein
VGAVLLVVAEGGGGGGGGGVGGLSMEVLNCSTNVDPSGRNGQRTTSVVGRKV